MRSACNSDARRRRSGQASAWTCATTTSRHSSPLDRCAVSRRTAAPRTPRSDSVSAGICWATSVARKLAHAEVVALLLSASRRVEQGHHGVEVAVGPSRGTSTRLDRAPEALWPRGAGPQRPEHLLGCGPVVELAPRPLEELVERASATCRRAGHSLEEPRFQDRQSHQLAGGPRSRSFFVGTLLLAVPQRAPEGADVTGVQPSERPHQQRLRASGVDVADVLRVVVVEVDDGPEGLEHRGHRRIAHQGYVVAGHLDRDACGAQCPAQAGDRGPAGPNQHGHLVPRQAVLEVGPAQQVGEVLGLGPLCVEGGHLDAALAHRAWLGIGVPERVAHGLVDRDREREPRSDASGCRLEARTEPSRRAEGQDVGGRPVCLGEGGRELEDAAHLCAAEGVDRLVRVAHHRQVTTVPPPGSAGVPPGPDRCPGTRRRRRAAAGRAARLGAPRPR